MFLSSLVTQRLVVVARSLIRSGKCPSDQTSDFYKETAEQLREEYSLTPEEIQRAIAEAELAAHQRLP